VEALIYTSTVNPEEAITACSLRQQQPCTFEYTRQLLLCHYQLCIEAGCRRLEHLLSIGEKYNFLSEYFSGFA
jgi:hypothetical protein